jgi:hypothetical protein
MKRRQAAGGKALIHAKPSETLRYGFDLESDLRGAFSLTILGAGEPRLIRYS